MSSSTLRKSRKAITLLIILSFAQLIAYSLLVISVLAVFGPKILHSATPLLASLLALWAAVNSISYYFLNRRVAQINSSSKAAEIKISTGQREITKAAA
ncbi:MAG: hypothetical protein D6719_00245 [Candidatus Dadabacteria bacterium]|nr:MAG: hypothetical protein D6719_00245 [Candidatus Dadabacteria bacterium]